MLVTGKVQGVYFRASTREKARQLGLKGWVGNHTDGSVHIIVRGKEPELSEFYQWVHKGPDWAEVHHVHCVEVNDQNQYDDFDIRR